MLEKLLREFAAAIKLSVPNIEYKTKYIHQRMKQLQVEEIALLLQNKDARDEYFQQLLAELACNLNSVTKSINWHPVVSQKNLSENELLQQNNILPISRIIEIRRKQLFATYSNPSVPKRDHLKLRNLYFGENRDTSSDNDNLPVVICSNGEAFAIYDLAQLGEGGSATLYLGLSLDTNQQVAIKLHELKNPNDFNHFINEAHILKKLEHLHGTFVSFEYSIAISVQTLHFGVDLFTYINANNTGHINQNIEIERVQLGIELLSELDQLHKRGILHRDLKPENVMVLDRNHYRRGNLNFCGVKIIDYGLAAVCKGRMSIRDPSLLGSTIYLAPEIIEENDSRYTVQSELYACGIILLELLHFKEIKSVLVHFQSTYDLKDKFNVPYLRKACFVLKHLLLNVLVLSNVDLTLEPLATIVQLLDNTPNNRPSASQVKKVMELHLAQLNITSTLTNLTVNDNNVTLSRSSSQEFSRSSSVVIHTKEEIEKQNQLTEEENRQDEFLDELIKQFEHKYDSKPQTFILYNEFQAKQGRAKFKTQELDTTNAERSTNGYSKLKKCHSF